MKIFLILFVFLSLASGYVYAVKFNTIRVVSEKYVAQCNNGKYISFQCSTLNSECKNGYGDKSKNKNDIAAKACKKSGND